MTIDLSRVRFGRIHEAHNPLIPQMRARMTVKASVAPASFDYGEAVDRSGGFQMLGNGPDATAPWLPPDGVGDCTCVTVLSLAQMRMANAWGSAWKPTTLQTVGLYEAAGGYKLGVSATDRGMMMRAPGGLLPFIAQHGLPTGLQGDEVPVPASVDPTDQDAIRHTAWEYCGLASGWSIPRAWLNSDSDIWDIPTGGLDSPAGQPGEGHEMTVRGIEPSALIVETWTLRKVIPWRAVEAYCMDMQVQLSRSWLETTGRSPAGFSFDQMEADRLALIARAA